MRTDRAGAAGGVSRRGPRRVQDARRVLAAAAVLLVLASASRLDAQQFGSPARVDNVARASFTGADGSTGVAEGMATVFVRPIPGATLSASHDVVVSMGGRVALPHVLTNTGTAADRFTLSPVLPAAWSATIYVDADASGTLTDADRPAGSSIVLEPGATAALLIVIDCPAGAREGDRITVMLRAVSAVDPNLVVQAGDRVSVRRATAPDLLVAKTVDRTAATNGDTLLYTITVRNRGGAATDSAALLTDVLPRGLRLVPNSVRRGSELLTDAADGDAATLSHDTLTVALGILAPDAAVAISFRAVVAAVPGERVTLANVASVSFGATTAVASTATSGAAETQLSFATLDLAKELVGADSIIVGREATYRLRFRNRGTIPARDVVLIDTLPEALEFVSAQPAATQVDGRVITWTLGAVDAGANGEILVRVRALREARSGEVINRAVIAGLNAAAAAAAAASLRIGDWTGDELVLTKRAGVLDAAIGEAVPYVLTVHNRGWDALRGVVIRDRLPAGTRLIDAGIAGADSVRRSGDEVEFFLGELPARADRTIRYAIVLGNPGAAEMLQNVAVASAENGRVRSDTIQAWVKVRRGFAMQSRTILGKVWVDADDDGVQDEGETGVPNAQIITADGHLVTTDKEGRFSLRDARTGSHALRLDTLGLPRGLRLARASDELVVVRTDGWTTPRVNFRLVPPQDECTCADSLRAAMLTPTSTEVSPPRAAAAPSVAPLRTAEEREAERRRAFVEGPVVRLAVPRDGAVVASNRVFIRVAGEPGARVQLYDGGRRIAESTLRPDGSQDFIGVELTTGLHRIRAAMKNSFGRERWDSIAVHRSGPPARMSSAVSELALRLEAPAPAVVEVRVVDEWDVPVADRPHVHVTARNLRLEGSDSDAGSVGEQRQVGADGVLRLSIRAGEQVGPGELQLVLGEARMSVRAAVLPSARPLVATGAGQVGIGAAPQSFGALTVRGAIDERTAVSVSYDSRRISSDDAFAQTFDPLDEGRMATYGDGSEQRALSASTQRFTARVERGYDWLAVGDVNVTPFGSGRLTSYTRALSGMSARVATGTVVWSGFASLTTQRFSQLQLRGDGGSGPYVFGGGIRRGTDRVAVEVRDRSNAARVIARQELAPFVDYTIDYATGAVLLRRPVPSADPYGNPMYVVATMERRGGADTRVVGGLRVETDVAPHVKRLGADSLVLGVVGVRGGGDGAVGVGADADLFGADLALTRGALQSSVELLRAQGGDSSANALRAAARWKLNDLASLDAEVLRVTSGFDRSLDPRLGAAMSEIRVGGELRLSADSRVALHTERQRFEQYGVERQVVRADAEQRLFGRRTTQELNFATDTRDGASAEGASMLAGKLAMALNSRAEVWGEAQHALTVPGADFPTRPNQVGVGTSYRLFQRVSLEAAHRRVWLARDSVTYALSSLGLRSEALFGGTALASVERASAARASHAAVLGWNNRVSLSKGWAAHSLFERRIGLDRANMLDPVRALPFAQAEQNRLSLGGGVEWLPGADRSRFSARGELHNAADRRGYRAELAGDASLGPDAALITYHDWSQYHRSLGAGAGREFSRMDRSLIGMALRPAARDVWNALAKLEWRRSLNPLGSVLSTAAEDARLIGAADAIWAPSVRHEVSARYAIRWAGTAAVIGDAPIKAQAHFIGVRADRALRETVALRTDGRFLVEARSGTWAWSFAPSVVWRADQRVEVETGWRLGSLVDRDFAANARTGLFVAISLRFTESALATPAAFWRERVARNP